ncbi:alkaline phosphatase 4-like [Uranotaenia lowii]|uniref:alkaline phosphatase 4-like n=1 Tax=Uranotaenia lowii TaxID=190385 RepID=UPI00247AA100|nr:alkaline phosphatase 4-like [Uranotaenia lowii]
MSTERVSRISRVVALSGLLCVLIIRNVADAAVFKSPNSDDALFWRKNAESHLKKVLHYGENSKTGAGVARNVIIFVGDGMGVASLSTGRIYKGQLANNSGEEEVLAFDSFPYTGFSKTYNTDRQVPDSAGTATAMFTGVKTNYGSIGVDSSSVETNTPEASVSNLMEWAQSAGKRTGIVTTTRVTHATPAASYAHIFHRDWECDTLVPPHLKTNTKDITRQLVENEPGNKLHVILGGGRDTFGARIPEQLKNKIVFNGSMEKTCIRQDGRDMVKEWLNSKNGTKVEYVWNTAQLNNVEVDEVDYLLGLFADTHMSYEKVRDKGEGGEPSLAEMTEKALRVLKRKNSNGYVLLVEGGRIDHGHHQNNPKLALMEVVELDRAVEKALGMVDLEDTLVIVTADHSHAMTFNGYPDRGNDILGFGNRPGKTPYETITYANGPGYFTHKSNSSEEASKDFGTWIPITSMNRTDITYQHMAALPLKDETHGGEDVAVFAAGPGASLVRGTFEQNYIAYVMSYAGCMGPAKGFNVQCGPGGRVPSSSGVRPMFVHGGGVPRLSQLFVSILFVAVAKMLYRR